MKDEDKTKEQLIEELKELRQQHKPKSELSSIYEDIIDESSLVIFVEDTEGKYLFVNKQGADYLNKSKEEIVGKTDFDFFSEEMAARFVEQNKLIIKGERIQR